MYKCKPCKQEFAKSGNFSRHKKSLKHIENTEKYEKKSTQIKNMHAKLKDEKKQQEIDTLKKIMKEKESYYMNVINGKDKIIDIMQTNDDFMKTHSGKLTDVIKNQAEANKKSMSAFKYITRTYNKTPALTQLNEKEIAGMLPYKPSGKGKHKFEQLVVRSEVENILFEYIGGLIVDKYKSDNPDNQPIWISDISRFAFIIRQNVITKDNKHSQRWVKDGEGIRITDLVVSPLLKRISVIMNEYIEDLDDLNNDKKTTNHMRADNVAKMETSNEVIAQIKLNQLHKKIVKHIAPYFNMSTFGADVDFDSKSI